MRYGWLTLMLALTLAPAPARAAPTPTRNTCAIESRWVHTAWQRDLFDASPAVTRSMLAAFEGRTADMRRDLAGLPVGQRMRWRDTALATAVAGNQPRTVAALLDDGVDPDSRDWVPPVKTAFFEATLGQLEHKPILHGHGKQTVKAMQKQGLIDNSGEYLPPSLFAASRCRLTAVAKVLLDHGANVNIRERLANGGRGLDPLAVAAIFGDAPVIRLLLERGATSCPDDRLIAHNAMHMHWKNVHTLASIGRKQGLPHALVARLQCRER
jgi:hypothetical protein